LSGLFDDVELDVAVGGKIWGNSSVSSVGSSSSVDSSLGANMGDLALFDIKSLLFSVGLKVDEEGNNMLDGLFWESTVMMVDIFAHGVSSWTTCESSEWNNGFVFEDSLHILDGLQEVETSA
jgi:hypothetical protein